MTAAKTAMKPKKPRNSPLTVNSNGQWSKVIHGKTCYFGPWDDHDGAVKRYLALLTNTELQKSSDPDDGMTIEELTNRWLDHKDAKVKSRELKLRTFDAYLNAGKIVVKQFGRSFPVDKLAPSDFAKLRATLAKRHKSLHVLKREMTLYKGIFIFGQRNNFTRPANYGTEFDVPTTRNIEKQRKQDPPPVFTAEEVRAAIEAARPNMRPMILLGINCGLGNSDILNLKTRHVKDGWLDYPRPKTGEDRRSKLWPETLQALEDYKRPKPNKGVDDDHVFLTEHGNVWGNGRSGGCPITHEFRKTLKRAGIYRPRLSFYRLRHTVQTIGENRTRDTIALKMVMGHKDATISANYRASIDDERLEAVAAALHSWLFD